MIANPFTTAIQKGIIVVGALAFVAVATTAGVLAWQLDGEKERHEECRTNAAALAARLDVQNAAVASWQEAASNAQASTRAALETARKVGNANKPELKRLADLVAAGRATDCGPAMAEIREGLR